MSLHDFVVKMRNRALGNDGASIHDVKAITYIETEVEVLFDQKDTNASFGVKGFERRADFTGIVPPIAFQSFFPAFFNCIANMVDTAWLNPLGRFVQHYYSGHCQQSSTHSEF